MERESMEFDVVIVGAGPSGLSTAIRLRQLGEQQGRDVSVCIVEKGSEVGAHIMSGAILETRAMDELLPDWRDRNAPIKTPVTDEEFWFLTASGGYKLPNAFLPPAMHNEGNFVISLGNLCRWLGEQAEALGVDIFPGFAATEVLYDEQGAVKGIATGDMGVGRNGEQTGNFQAGMELQAKLTVFAEGCRGHLGRQLMRQFDLRDGVQDQTFGLGIKELWEVKAENHKPGLMQHSIGWPLAGDTYGGSFLYHLEDKQVAVGFVVGLDYSNPYLSPYEEFQRFKTHANVRDTFTGGRRIAYGARALNEGGMQCLPKLSFPGGVLVGCDAGTLNMPKIKGIHNAMKSGMLAAETTFKTLQGEPEGAVTVGEYQRAFDQSWVAEELHNARNVRPSFRWGLWGGFMYSGIDQLVLRGKAPWTLRHAHADHQTLKKAAACRPIEYPKPDGELTFDRLTNVSFSGTNHEEDQPVHLTLKDANAPVHLNLAEYQGPEQRYCPAGVYEFVEDPSGPQLQINAQNCLHCKTCDIKDPGQNIVWVVPEGGGGPNYPNM